MICSPRDLRYYIVDLLPRGVRFCQRGGDGIQAHCLLKYTALLGILIPRSEHNLATIHVDILDNLLGGGIAIHIISEGGGILDVQRAQDGTDGRHLVRHPQQAENVRTDLGHGGRASSSHLELFAGRIIDNQLAEGHPERAELALLEKVGASLQRGAGLPLLDAIGDQIRQRHEVRGWIFQQRQEQDKRRAGLVGQVGEELVQLGQGSVGLEVVRVAWFGAAAGSGSVQSIDLRPYVRFQLRYRRRVGLGRGQDAGNFGW